MAAKRAGERRSGVYADDRPQVLYKAEISRKPYRRGMRYSTLLILAGLGVWFLPSLLPETAPLIPPPWDTLALNVGQIAAGLLVVVGAARLVASMFLYVRRQPERIIFYDQGFVWERRKERHRYGWSAVKTVIEDPHAWVFRGKPRLQWGHITLKTRDGAAYRFTGTHGSMLAFLGRVRPYYAEVIGERMGQRLRLDKPFRIHPKVAVVPAGLVINSKKQVKWEQLNLEIGRKHLIIQQITPSGDIQEAGRVPLKEVENLAGFMDLAEQLIETFQRPNPYAR